MAVKHIKEYYEQICNQYIQMNEELRDFQKEVENGLVEPERIENLKKMIEPLKNNYMTISWIMYLLNKPQRDSKERAYQKRNKKFIESLDKNFDKESIMKQNDEVIKNIGEV
jgi:molecular chaperone GrpE (heat shock protein)